MFDSHSISDAASGKPAKPSPDFPCCAHAARRWAKKIKGTHSERSTSAEACGSSYHLREGIRGMGFAPKSDLTLTCSSPSETLAFQVRQLC
jgi:hypothetical protein